MSKSLKIVDDVEAIPEEEQNIVFKPNEGPQTEFLASPEREVLYGGSAGGGKSYAMLADPLRYMGHPQFSGLLLTTHDRRTKRTCLEVKRIVSPHMERDKVVRKKDAMGSSIRCKTVDVIPRPR